jgi:large subunit ribosomal protein L30
MIAVVRVRGAPTMKIAAHETLKMLGLKDVNNCVLVPENPVYKGMVEKVKDYVTWGEVFPAMVEKLILKRGKAGQKKFDNSMLKEGGFSTLGDYVKKLMSGEATMNDIGLSKTFRLTPPSKGYEHRGIKKPFSVGGALGHRGEKINSLLERMV